MNSGAQKCVTQRVTNNAGCVTSLGFISLEPKKSRVIEDHQRDHRPAQGVDEVEPWPHSGSRRLREG